MSKKIKTMFPGSDGNQLAGLLELPDGKPRTFALFAHCFTCGKDVVAASRISRELVKQNIGVFRFDFTGLGNSDGDFSNSNFSSNVEDLIKAAEFLRREYAGPGLLIGHSLGGTAVLNGAQHIPEALGVVTIGSPAEARHVAKQFSMETEEINTKGSASVQLAGRSFTIKKQFLEDIEAQSDTNISGLGKSLLIFHSPLDNIVSIDQAERIYRKAKHPKSFISLGKADHLLSRKQDAQYVAETISTWAKRVIDDQIPEQFESLELDSPEKGHVIVEERNRSFAQNVRSDHHVWLADEPTNVGGTNLGPDPYEHLLASLGTCTSMTIRMYANRKKWPLDKVSISVNHYREHGEDCHICDTEYPQIEVIRREITLFGDLSEEQKKRLLEIADRCPVHKTLHGKLVIDTTLA